MHCENWSKLIAWTLYELDLILVVTAGTSRSVSSGVVPHLSLKLSRWRRNEKVAHY